MFGDEIGLFWDTPIRQSRAATRRELVFNAENINVQSSWEMPEELPELDGPVAIDLETHDPSLRTIGPSWAFAGEGRVAGFAVADRSRQWYFPTQHANGSNLPHAHVVNWLRHQLAKPTLEPIFANAPYDVGWLTVREGLKIAGPIHDVQIQMTLLDEHRFEYGLDAIGMDLFGVGKDDHLMRRAIEQALGLTDAKEHIIKGHLHECPAQFVGPYGERDARLTFDIWLELKEQIAREGLMQIYALEQAMVPIAVGMRARGVRTDPDKAEQVRAFLQQRENELIEEVRKATGVSIDPWDASSIARALRVEGITPPQTKQGKDSIRKEWLDASPSLTAKAVRQLRVYNKARTTFIDGHILGHARDGRIHCQFHQLRGEDDEGRGRGAITGRWSSSDPNLQQTPKRNKEIRKLIRTLCLPDEGEEWASLDYSSQEPRLILHFANCVKPEIPGARAAMETYLANPRTDYHQMVADFCGISRDDAKPINLGIGYGMGGAKLCRSLGLPVEYCLVKDGKWTRVDPNDFPEEQRSKLVEVAGPEGKALLDKYHSGAPFIKGMIETCQKRGGQRGYITTIEGRKGRFPRMPDGSRLGAHAALNKLAQGSAADQMKRAMQILHQHFGVMPLLTMHDELGLSVKTYEEARFAADVMELAIELKVPSIVDVKMGPNWGDVEERDPVPSLGKGTTAREAMSMLMAA